MKVEITPLKKEILRKYILNISPVCMKDPQAASDMIEDDLMVLFTDKEETKEDVIHFSNRKKQFKEMFGVK
jgi:hypothetical protein